MELLGALGVVGASMFYGSSFITPALSVMSAVEGLREVSPQFDGYIVPPGLGNRAGVLGAFAQAQQSTTGK